MRLVGRRLPDVLIGILIVVLALGLGSLLLTQRNRAATPNEPSPPAATATIPSAPGTSQVTPSAPAQTTDGASPAAQMPTATDNAAAPVGEPPRDQAAADQPSPAATATAPEAATTPPASTPPASTPPNGSVPTGDVQAPVTLQPNTTAAPVPTTPPVSNPAPSGTVPSSTAATPTPTPVTPRSGGAVATSESRTPLRRDYRISLGTFGSQAEAEASTKDVRALGYTVYPIDLGSQVVAQVGPFADAQTADAALGDIQRVYGGALVYAPRQSATGTPATSTPASSNAAAPAAPAASSAAPSNSGSTPATSAATPKPAAPQPATAPSGPVYLQVGAFDRQDSAQRLVGMLSDLGYSPSVQAPEGQKVRVLIGPFAGNAVVQAENKLNDNGFDHFRVR